MLRRLAAVLLGTGAREVRKRPRAVGIAAVLLVGLAAVTALEQPANPQRNASRSGSALGASQFRGVFLSEVTRGLAALSRSGFSASIGTVAQAHSGSRARRPSRTARATRQSEQPRDGRAGVRELGPLDASEPRWREAVTPSRRHPAAGSDSGTTAAASPADSTPAQQAPVQQTPVQQTSTQQPVHYQPPAQPAGPAGLGSQVGGNCNPKCS